jgi:hypothetical protein
MYLKKYIYLFILIDMFYCNQFLYNLSNQFFKNFILIKFKGIICMFIKQISF